MKVRTENKPLFMEKWSKVKFGKKKISHYKSDILTYLSDVRQGFLMCFCRSLGVFCCASLFVVVHPLLCLVFASCYMTFTNCYSKYLLCYCRLVTKVIMLQTMPFSTRKSYVMVFCNVSCKCCWMYACHSQFSSWIECLCIPD